MGMTQPGQQPNIPIQPGQVQPPAPQPSIVQQTLPVPQVQGQPAQQTVDSGSQFMGVPPQQAPVQQPAQQPTQQPNFLGTPYQTPEQLAEGYRNLQARYTQDNQRYASLQQDWNSLIQGLANQQPQPAQTQQPQRLLDLDDAAFTKTIEDNPKDGLRRLAEEVAISKLQPTIDQLQKQVQASQIMLNTQALNRTLETMQQTYSSYDPNYQQNLNTAVEMVLGPLKPAAEQDPAATLNMAYEMVVGRQLRDPNFVNQLQQSALQRQQQVEANKQMAGLTSNAAQTTQMPYQPYNVQPSQTAGKTPQQIAREILLASDPSLIGTNQNMQVVYNPF